MEHDQVLEKLRLYSLKLILDLTRLAVEWRSSQEDKMVTHLIIKSLNHIG